MFFTMPDLNVNPAWIIPVAIFLISLKGFTKIKEREQQKRGGCK